MAVARDATIIVVATTGTFSSTSHAVDDALAPVISLSMGICETLVAGVQPTQYRALAQQANAEGITWVTGSSDLGASGCEAKGGTNVAGHGLAVGFPAGVPEITATGGTQFIDADSSYWSTATTPTGFAARSYIPEVVWNENAAGTFLASGGGASVLYPKPAWQNGPGVPRDGRRDVPDIALIASCGRSSFYGVVNGKQGPTLCGTSASGPAFAGVLALLNQYLVSTGAIGQAGLGNVNPSLYRLAQTNPAAFHDITAGDNVMACLIGTPDCPGGSLGFGAGPGYDLATGLGSIDVYNLVTQWNSGGSTVTSVSPGSASLAVNGSLKVTATVAAAGGGATPTGSISLANDTQVFANGTLASGAAVFTLYGSQFAAGVNNLAVVYSGDASYNGSSATLAINVTAPSAGSAVIPVIAPNPVYQLPPDADGNTFRFAITLSETAGTATTLTGFTIDGAAQTLSKSFQSPAIPANGSISTSIAIAPSVPSTHTYGFSGTDASGFQWHQEAMASFYGPRIPAIAAVSNAASGDPLGVTPGSIAAVYGLNLAGSTLVASSVPLPMDLGGVTATVNGIPAPLYFVSPAQVNLQIPYEATGGQAVVSVRYNGYESISASGPVGAPVNLFPTGPGIFVDGGGNLVPFSSGARGQILTLFVTGYGAVTPKIATGAAPAAGTPLTQLPTPSETISLTVGGQSAPISFAGIPSGLVGAMQVNFQVPNNAPLGPQPVVITVGGRLSRATGVILTVTQ